MTLIYIVRGSTGEWSDRTDWPIMAFNSKAKAQEYIQRLERTYKSFSGNRGHQRADGETRALSMAMQDLDPAFNEDYTGTIWFMESCKIKGDDQ